MIHKNKLNRHMDEYFSWQTFSEKNNLDVKNKVESIDEHNQTRIDFDIFRNDELITHVVRFYTQSQFEPKQKYTRLEQKLYISFLTKEEADWFNAKVGSPILLIDKKAWYNNSLIFTEREYSLPHVYKFIEGGKHNV